MRIGFWARNLDVLGAFDDIFGKSTIGFVDSEVLVGLSPQGGSQVTVKACIATI